VAAALAQNLYPFDQLRAADSCCGPFVLQCAAKQLREREFASSFTVFYWSDLAERQGFMTEVGKQRSLHSRLLQSEQDAQRAQLTWLEPFPFHVDGPFQQLVRGRMQSGV
jgi:hypothetical protein